MVKFFAVAPGHEGLQRVDVHQMKRVMRSRVERLQQATYRGCVWLAKRVNDEQAAGAPFRMALSRVAVGDPNEGP